MTIATIITHTCPLTFRAIKGDYYVTNGCRREVVVMNHPAFQILQLCHGKTKQELHAVLEKTPGCSQLSSREMTQCLDEFKTLQLINC